jgi:hypothetical protein
MITSEKAHIEDSSGYFSASLITDRERLRFVKNQGTPPACIPPEVLRFELELQDPIDIGDGTYLRRKEPLLVKVEVDADGLHSSAPDISFDDLVEDYQDLISTTNAMCVLLWQEYALADDANLADDARQLKQRILRDFEVV